MKKLFASVFIISLLYVLGFPISTVLAAGQSGTTLSATKTATGNWTRSFTWTIDKSVTHPTWNLFDGDDGTSQYTVAVTKSSGTDALTVSGQVCVTNGGDISTHGLQILDVIQTKSGAGQYQDYSSTQLDLSAKPELAAGESHCYPYEIPFTPVNDALYRNVARVSITNHSGWLPGGPHCEGPDPCSFGPEPKTDFSLSESPTLVNDSVHVTDTNGQSWEFSASGLQQYTKKFSCPEDSGTHDNTATITETGQSDSASVVVHCYDPSVTKTALTSFDRTYDWNIDKTGDQTNLTLAKNESFDVHYTVTPSATPSDSNWAVHGTITIHNSAPMSAVINSVTDMISSDISGAVTCPGSSPYTISGDGDLVCTYTADLPDDTSRTNTAKAVQQNYSYADDGTATKTGTTDYTGTASVEFSETTPTEIDLCASVTDDKYGSLGNVCANQSFAPFTYTLQIGPYTSCGSRTFVNSATVTGNTTQLSDTDFWTVDTDVPCILGCTLTIGYWKNHSGSQKGPQSNMIAPLLKQCLGGLTSTTLGCSTFGPASLAVITSPIAYQILSMSYNGGMPSNGITKLYAQLLAAKLNIQSGASNTISSAINAADTFLSTHTQSDWKNLSKSQQALVLSLMTTLDNYNNGLRGVPHCSQ